MTRPGEYVTNVVAQAAGRVATAAASLGVAALVARFLGVEVYGRFSYVLVFLAVLVGLAEFGTNTILARELAGEGSTSEYWGNFLAVRLGLSLLVAALALPVAWLTGRELWTYLTVGALALPFLASRFFEPVFQAFRRPGYSTLSSSLYGALLLASVLAVLLAGGGLMSVLVAYLLSNLAYTIGALLLAGRLLRPRFDVSWQAIAGVLRAAAPVGIGSVIAVVNSRADVFLLGRLGSVYEVGIYTAAYRILELAGVVAIVLMTPAIQIFAAERRDRARLVGTFGKILEGVGVLTAPVAILIPYVSQPLVTAVFGPGFGPSAAALDTLAWVGALVFFFLFGFALCVALEAVRFGAWITAAAASLNIALNFLWIPGHGHMGTAWARLVSDIVLTAGTLGYVLYLVGNVFRAGPWLKIFGLWAGLWLLLRALAPLGASGLAMAAVLYASGVIALRAFPKDLLSLGRPSP